MDAGVTSPLIDLDHTAIKCKLRFIVRLKKKSSPRERLVKLDYTKLKIVAKRNCFLYQGQKFIRREHCH